MTRSDENLKHAQAIGRKHCIQNWEQMDAYEILTMLDAEYEGLSRTCAALREEIKQLKKESK